MNTKRVQAAEDVILAALKSKQTAAGVAIALESACLLQSPETVVEQRRAVIAERDAQVVAWLAKKAAEYGTSNRENRAKAEAVGRMADKLSRGAVRDDETGVSRLYGLRSENNQLRAEVAALQAERHSTNEALSKAVERLAELEAAAAKVAEFCAQRAEYVDNLRNCNPDNGHDYDRWQGHAAARRQLSRLLGLPVGWPAEDTVKPHPTEGELAEQRHLMDPLDHALEALAPRAVAPVTPSACRWCGVEKRSHFQQWKPPVGWHTHVPPTQALIKARMLARRQTRTTSTAGSAL